MYRAPISSRRDAIGLAIGGGLSALGGGVAEGLAERRRRDIEAGELARRDRLEKEERERANRAEARAERARLQELHERGARVLSEEDAYNTIEGASAAPVMRAGAAAAPTLPGPFGAAIAGIGAAADAVERAPGPIRQRRPGVESVGGEYIEFDPNRSWGAQERAAEAARAREVAEREVQRNAEIIRRADPSLSVAETEMIARGLSSNNPVTRARARQYMQQDLELADQFKAREQARDIAGRVRVASATQRGIDRTANREARRAAGEGYSFSAASRARREAAEMSAQLAAVGRPMSAPQLQEWVEFRTRSLITEVAGQDFSGPEIDALTFRAIHALEDQAKQIEPKPETPTERIVNDALRRSNPELFGPDPIRGAVSPDAAPRGPAQPASGAAAITAAASDLEGRPGREQSQYDQSLRTLDEARRLGQVDEAGYAERLAALDGLYPNRRYR
jgi:hypothetical protein